MPRPALCASSAQPTPIGSTDATVFHNITSPHRLLLPRCHRSLVFSPRPPQRPLKNHSRSSATTGPTVVVVLGRRILAINYPRERRGNDGKGKWVARLQPSNG